MKTRIGFVSNSSSTSFIVLLPPNFNAETDIEWEKIKKGLFEYNKDVADEDKIPMAKKLVKSFIKNQYMWDGDGYKDAEEMVDVYTVKKALDKYVIMEVEGGADDGSSINLLDPKKVKKIMEGKL